MLDNLLDFWEDHRKLCIVLIVVVVLVVAMFVVRGINMANKPGDEVMEQTPPPQSGLDQDRVEESEPGDDYRNQLGLDADKWTDGRVQVTDEVDETPEPTQARRTPRYFTEANVFAFRAVPEINQDGSRCKDYYNKVKLADFGTFWGDKLTAEDFLGSRRIFVGVEEKEYSSINNLQSVGWLISNLDTLAPNDAIQFTNLHVIGHLSSTHVAMLCSYDWYSVHGMDDTLVVFEDISGTLKTSDFKEGDIFNALVFVHNIKVMDDVAGQRVVVCEFAVYDEDLYW